MRVGLARAGRDGVAARGEHRHCRRADPARRAADDHGAAFGRDPGGLDRFKRDRRSEAGGTQHHRLLRAETFGRGHEPVGGHAHALGVAARVPRAQLVARRDHRVAGAEAGVGRFDDRAREINPRHHRVGGHDAPVGSAGQAILVVEAGPLDGDGHLAVGQLGVVPLLDAETEIVVALVDHEGAKGHGRTPLRIAQAGTGWYRWFGRISRARSALGDGRPAPHAPRAARGARRRPRR